VQGQETGIAGTGTDEPDPTLFEHREVDPGVGGRRAERQGELAHSQYLRVASYFFNLNIFLC
jgi:hypothetical protein